jgi:hypothetical protein
MSDEQNSLTPDELEGADGEPLPDREAMSIVTPGDPVQILPAEPIDPPADGPTEPQDE